MSAALILAGDLVLASTRVGGSVKAVVGRVERVSDKGRNACVKGRWFKIGEIEVLQHYEEKVEAPEPKPLPETWLV